MSTPWMNVAKRLLNTKEAKGASNNLVIISWAKKIGGWVSSFYTKDEIPWCGLFVAHCLMEARAKNLPANPLRALAWSSYGISTQPRIAAVMVFKRPGGGHVGFYVAENATSYLIRGGNQSDSVSDAWISKSRFVAARWPKEFPVNTKPKVVSHQGRLSTNEA